MKKEPTDHTSDYTLSQFDLLTVSKINHYRNPSYIVCNYLITRVGCTAPPPLLSWVHRGVDGCSVMVPWCCIRSDVKACFYSSEWEDGGSHERLRVEGEVFWLIGGVGEVMTWLYVQRTSCTLKVRRFESQQKLFCDHKYWPRSPLKVISETFSRQMLLNFYIYFPEQHLRPSTL